MIIGNLKFVTYFEVLYPFYIDNSLKNLKVIRKLQFGRNVEGYTDGCSDYHWIPMASTPLVA